MAVSADSSPAAYGVGVLDRVMRGDRGRWVAIGLCGLFGLAMLTSAGWVAHRPTGSFLADSRLVGGGVVGGVIFLGFATYELVVRLRRGPQPPGRHAR